MLVGALHRNNPNPLHSGPRGILALPKVPLRSAYPSTPAHTPPFSTRRHVPVISQGVRTTLTPWGKHRSPHPLSPPLRPARDGLTPLHLALSYGTSQMLPMLLRCGANPMLTDNLDGRLPPSACPHSTGGTPPPPMTPPPRPPPSGGGLPRPARNALHVATSQAMPKVVEALLLDPGVEGDARGPLALHHPA